MKTPGPQPTEIGDPTEPVSEAQLLALKEYAIESAPRTKQEARALLQGFESAIHNAIEQTFDHRTAFYLEIFRLLTPALRKASILKLLPRSGTLSQEQREQIANLGKQVLPEQLFATLRIKGRAETSKDIRFS